MKRLLGMGLACIAVLFSEGAVSAARLSTTPEAEGLSSERLERITEKFSHDIEAGINPGAVILVARDGKVA